MFLGAQTLVLGDEQHSVARGDAEERNESDDGRDAYLARSQHDGEDATDERQGKIEEYHSCLHGVAELHEEEAEDDDNGEDAGEIEHAAGALLALKLTTVLDVIALGQLHFFAYGLLDVCHYVAQCSAAGVGRDNYLALHVLTIDGVWTGA